MIVIIDYGVGNLKSIKNILKKVGSVAEISASKDDISNATKLILPGVGNFDHCMKTFNQSGLRDIVENKVISGKTPVLGICAGCQMLMEGSEEGTETGLSWLPGKVVHFDAGRLTNGAKIPHMGWANVQPKYPNGLYENITDPRFYFVHSFHIDGVDDTYVTATANYGYEFVASVQK